MDFKEAMGALDLPGKITRNDFIKILDYFEITPRDPKDEDELLNNLDPFFSNVITTDTLHAYFTNDFLLYKLSLFSFPS